MIELLAGLLEGLIALISSVIEAIASLFAGGGEALGAGEALIVLGALLVEFIFWVALWLVELVSALFQWRKPKKIAKPIIWRPKKRRTMKEVGKSVE